MVFPWLGSITLLLLWVCCTAQGAKNCGYIQIQNGSFYHNEDPRTFPRRLGSEIHYRCSSGFLPPEKGYYDYGTIRCTRSGWDPEPKCLKKCEHRSPLRNGKFIHSYWNSFIEGDPIFYSCNEGYYPANKNASVTCTKDGWSPPPKCVTWQEMLPSCKNDPPLHGFFVNPKTKFSLNEKVAYGCQSGFTTKEGHERGETQCLEDGWRPEPKCIKTCPKPAEENANFPSSKTTYLLNDILSYECKDGFQTVTETSEGQTQCTENGWDPNPVCLPIECEGLSLEHGRINKRQDKYVNGEVIQFSCLKKYKRVGPDSAQCYYFGWYPQPPICKATVKPCVQPNSTIPHGSADGVLHEEYQHGEKVVYECNVGFAMTGSNTIECVDGKWTSLPSCTELCLPPPQIPNAVKITEMRNYRSGEEVSFTCMEHFVRKGPQKITCEGGRWQTPPRCVDKRCGDPPPIPHGEAKGGASRKYDPGETVEYLCHDGFEIDGSSTATCGNMGWSQLPSCKEKSCQKPSPIDNASYPNRVKNVYDSGETVDYECHPGFAAEGPQTITCRRGEWSQASTCEDANCREPPVVDNADIVEERAEPYQPGHELHYQCHEGFEISGSNTIRCENKVWSTLPKCEDATCPPPPAVLNGRINGHRKAKYMPLEKVSYRCDSPYSLFGPSTTMCLKKEWTDIPECKVAGGRCDRPPSIDNGDILEMAKSEYMSGEKVHYKCQNLYRMEGTAEVECYNGHWTQPPTCIAPCTASEDDMKINNIRLRWRGDPKLYLEAGDRVEFTCRTGYDPDPSSPPFAVRCVDGRFEYPRCIRQAKDLPPKVTPKSPRRKRRALRRYVSSDSDSDLASGSNKDNAAPESEESSNTELPHKTLSRLLHIDLPEIKGRKKQYMKNIVHTTVAVIIKYYISAYQKQSCDGCQNNLENQESHSCITSTVASISRLLRSLCAKICYKTVIHTVILIAYCCNSLILTAENINEILTLVSKISKAEKPYSFLKKMLRQTDPLLFQNIYSVVTARNISEFIK